MGTLFHHSHVGLHKWFEAIYIFLKKDGQISSRSLALRILVTKNTAASMLKKIRKFSNDTPEELKEIYNFWEKNFKP